MNKKRAQKLAFFHIAEIKQFFASRTLCNLYLHLVGISPPKAANDESFYLRLSCVDWWSRRLIAKHLKDQEAAIIHKGQVARGRQIYCSDDTIDFIKHRQDKSFIAMSTKLCVSDDCDEIDMLDILKSSIANPENRRSELMVRIAGFEQYADELGHVGMFYTITCPSKYHRFSGPVLNENYNHTPREGQAYLTKLWAQIRAQLKRDGLAPYGFRVAEPHHDGTPHWHMLLFMPKEQVESCNAIMRDYALREDGREPGAGQHRFTAKKIVKEIITKDGVKKVSATGYIAKYIAKNIGFDIGDDSEDDTQSTADVSMRVRSWASVWGIRQFQQIGGASVTVWRELRRLKDHEIEDEVIRKARDCCIAGDWSGFLTAMGGNDVKRIERSIQLLKKNSVDPGTGGIKLNKYKEIVLKIVGVCTAVHEVITHFKNWRIIDKQCVNANTFFCSKRGPTRSIKSIFEHLEFYQ